MKTSLFLALALVLAVPARLVAADSSPNEAVAAAAKKLADQPNYSWKTVVVVPESVQFKPGPTDGKTEKDGFTCASTSFGDNGIDMVKKGDKGAITDNEGNWKLGSELEKEEGPGRFLSFMVKGLKTPAEQVGDLVAGAKEMKHDGEIYAGVLTAEGVKKQYRFGEPKDPKGSFKIWVKDGMVVKFEVKL
ncbi:MAG TPA: hypothetical protein VHH73_17870, partial [Verrucomicrobiae bacterium]|nr:hypothetical protein [Verrucomicrobiae bacterium]